MILAAAQANPLEHIVQHPLVTRPMDLGLFTPKGVVTVLSDQIVMMMVAALLLILFVPRFVRKRKGTDEIGSRVPTGFGNLLETLCQYLREEVARPALGEYTDRFIKYIWSIFFFILTINLLGLLPIAPISQAAGLHLGGTATGNIWVTGTFAAMTLVLMVWNGLRLGGKHYLAHFCPGPLWLSPLLVPLEIVGLFAKCFALTVRLFANMLAGHTLLAVLLGFLLSTGSMGIGLGMGIAIPTVLGSVAIMLLEIFVAFLQAFIFTFLTTLFLGQSVVFHHDDHDDHHEAAAAH